MPTDHAELSVRGCGADPNEFAACRAAQLASGIPSARPAAQDHHRVIRRRGGGKAAHRPPEGWRWRARRHLRQRSCRTLRPGAALAGLANRSVLNHLGPRWFCNRRRLQRSERGPSGSLFQMLVAPRRSPTLRVSVRAGSRGPWRQPAQLCRGPSGPTPTTASRSTSGAACLASCASAYAASRTSTSAAPTPSKRALSRQR